MVDSVEREIRELRALFWSDRDPEGRAFAPLADAYRRMGDLEQALEVVNDGLDRHVDFAPGFVVAGWVRRARGESELAGEAFRSALALDDENTEALRGLAEVADERGEPALAADCRRRLAELEPGANGSAPPTAEAEPLPSFEEATFEATALDRAPDPSATADDPWGVEPDRAATTDVVPPDENAHTADIVVDFDAPDASAAEGSSRTEPAPPAVVAGRSPAPKDPWASPVRASADSEDGPVTRTMADLYARQNLHARALRLYRRLLERTPHDAGLAERVREMEARLGVEATGTAEHPIPIADLAPSPIDGPIESAPEVSTGAPAAEAAPAPTGASVEAPVAEAAPAPTETPSVAPRPSVRATRPPRDADVETLARDWAEGPGDTGELSTPFAWSTRPAERPTPDTAAGRPIGDYFRSLLKWEPGMAPEAAATVEPGVEAVQAAAAAPHTVVSIESLAPTVVDVGALAPHVVDIATLA